jgi:hypothetical protein
MLADRVMGGEKGSEFKTRHGVLSGLLFFGLAPNYGLNNTKAIDESGWQGWVVVRPRKLIPPPAICLRTGNASAFAEFTAWGPSAKRFSPVSSSRLQWF